MNCKTWPDAVNAETTTSCGLTMGYYTTCGPNEPTPYDTGFGLSLTRDAIRQGSERSAQLGCRISKSRPRSGLGDHGS